MGGFGYAEESAVGFPFLFERGHLDIRCVDLCLGEPREGSRAGICLRWIHPYRFLLTHVWFGMCRGVRLWLLFSLWRVDIWVPDAATRVSVSLAGGNLLAVDAGIWVCDGCLL